MRSDRSGAFILLIGDLLDRDRLRQALKSSRSRRRSVRRRCQSAAKQKHPSQIRSAFPASRPCGLVSFHEDSFRQPLGCLLAQALPPISFKFLKPALQILNCKVCRLRLADNQSYQALSSLALNGQPLNLDFFAATSCSILMPAKIHLLLKSNQPIWFSLSHTLMLDTCDDLTCVSLSLSLDCYRPCSSS